MRSGFITLAVVAIVLGVVMWKAPPPQAPAPAAVGAAAPQAQVAPAQIAQPTPPRSAPAVSVQSEHEARTAFHERVRAFFAQASILPPEEKQQMARELEVQIEEYESRRELSAAEAFTLRLALISETAPESEQRERMEALRDQYRARDAQRAPKESDPMFELYRAREQEIVAHVQSLHEIPGGLTREEYLRERLQQEREELFGESGR